MSVIDPILRGAAASAVGTLVMDASIYRRYRHGGGTDSFPAWESSEGLASWENAPAPARVAKRFLEGVLKHDVSPRYVRLLNNVTHWGFGLAAGAGYGILIRSRRSRLWYGVPFGAAVWASGYVILPQLGVYKQIWEYDLETLREDLTGHLVFGTATAAAFSLLTSERNSQ
jgi:hypothetical protein